MTCLVKFNSFAYTKSLIMRETVFKQRHFCWAQYLVFWFKVVFFSYFLFVVYLCDCKWKRFFVLNAFIDKKRCSLGIAILKNLFHLCSNSHLLFSYSFLENSQMTFNKWARSKKSKVFCWWGPLLVWGVAYICSCMFSVGKISSSCTFYALKTDET